MNQSIMSISKITNQIFLSGTIPLAHNPNYISQLNIKYILSCVDNQYVRHVHEKIMMSNPDVTILYLPYNDNVNQNLWKTNKNNISVSKYTNNFNEPKTVVDPCKSILSTFNSNNVSSYLQSYHERPMIEIGYHFMDTAISSGNNILIHCMAGISRSVSIVIYYFMKKFGTHFNETLNAIKKIRSIANPNSSFQSQLKLYDNIRDKFTEYDANYIIKSI